MNHVAKTATPLALAGLMPHESLRAISNWTGAPGSPKRTWAENDIFECFQLDGSGGHESKKALIVRQRFSANIDNSHHFLIMLIVFALDLVETL